MFRSLSLPLFLLISTNIMASIEHCNLTYKDEFNLRSLCIELSITELPLKEVDECQEISKTANKELYDQCVSLIGLDKNNPVDKCYINNFKNYESRISCLDKVQKSSSIVTNSFCESINSIHDSEYKRLCLERVGKKPEPFEPLINQNNIENISRLTFRATSPDGYIEEVIFTEINSPDYISVNNSSDSQRSIIDYISNYSYDPPKKPVNENRKPSSEQTESIENNQEPTGSQDNEPSELVINNLSAYHEKVLKVVKAKDICKSDTIDFSKCVKYQLKELKVKPENVVYDYDYTDIEIEVIAHKECANKEDNSKCVKNTIKEISEKQSRAYTYMNPVELDDSLFTKEALEKYPPAVPVSCVRAAVNFNNSLDLAGKAIDKEFFSPFIFENNRLMFSTSGFNNDSDQPQINIYKLETFSPYRITEDKILDHEPKSVQSQKDNYANIDTKFLHNDKDLKLSYVNKGEQSSTYDKYCITGRKSSGCGIKNKIGQDAMLSSTTKEDIRSPASQDIKRNEIPYDENSSRKVLILKKEYSGDKLSQWNKVVESDSCSDTQGNEKLNSCIDAIAKLNPECKVNSQCLQHLLWRKDISKKNSYSKNDCDIYKNDSFKNACLNALTSIVPKETMMTSSINEWKVRAEPIFINAVLKGISKSYQDYKKETGKSLNLSHKNFEQCAKSLSKSNAYKDKAQEFLANLDIREIDEEIILNEEGRDVIPN